MRKFITAITALAAICSAQSAEIEFSYDYEGIATEDYGYGKAETYDVAVRLSNPSFVGAKITGVRVPLSDAGVAETSAWVTKELTLKKKNGRNVNVPDMTSAEGTVSDGWLDITFETPQIVPEEGCYVGYSFTVKNLDTDNAAPVSVCWGANPDGLWLHSSRTKLRWGSMAGELGRVSRMSVRLEGDFPAGAAVFNFTEPVSGAIDEPVTAYLNLVNCGLDEIRSVGYVYGAGESAGTGSLTLEKPIPAHIGESAPVNLVLGSFPEKGEFPLNIKVTEVNGMPCDCVGTTGILRIYPFVPVNRPIVEEYTGLWCGWCPRGYVALETMRERKEDLFVGVAYHNGDAMAFGGKLPNTPDGYPSGYINRSTALNLARIYTDWEKYRRWIPEGGVEVEVEWADADHTAVRATARTRFILDRKGADYRLSYILVADGLRNPGWRQHNSYSGSDKIEDMPGELGKLFLDGGDYVSGLTFNDVAVLGSDLDGVRGSVPSDIEAGEEYVSGYTFNLSDVGVDSAAVLGNPGKLRVIAVITDAKTDKFINCNTSLHMDGTTLTDGSLSSIEETLSETPLYETAWYTIDGRVTSVPVPGINIVRYSDGSVRKVYVSGNSSVMP